VIAIQLSAPVLIVLFLVDVAFGVLNKIAPQINVHYESQTVKSLVGLVIVILTIGFVMARLDREFARMIQDLYNVTRLFA
jgi:flagellar biosynthetic protein FliR